MKKNSKTTDVAVVATSNEVKINTESKTFQKRLMQEIKKQKGESHRGRPVDPDSDRQQRIAELNEKKENGTLKLGRPAYSPEEKAIAAAEKKAKAAAEKQLIAEMAQKMLSGEVE